MVSLYEHGDHIWSGFPAAGRAYIIPPKGLYIKKDSVHIRAPYINGQLWYEGDFCLLYDNLNQRMMTRSYGIHIVYHMNGKIKGYADFSKETLKEYDTLGKLKYETKFNDYETHFHPIISRH
ncbi:MAG: hypothetical protein HRT57_13800 [Crocinitomicaceae bacterium]|nr:hypothetical protein [Crocinitomicaceae bacterium]